MLGKIVTGIVVAELIGFGLLGAWVYSEARYIDGRRDAYKDVNDTLGKLIIDTAEKHESEREES